MLHTKFQGHQSIGSGEDFFKVFTIYGHGGHVGHVTQLICISFQSYSPSSYHMNFGSTLPNCFCKKQVTFAQGLSDLCPRSKNDLDL